MDRSEAVAHVEQLCDAWLREDVDGYLRLFADDFVFCVNGVELTRGRLALENAVRRSYLRLRPVSWEFHSIAVDGDTVLAEWTVETEERTTGSRRVTRAMSICQIQSGRTIWQREYRLPGG